MGAHQCGRHAYGNAAFPVTLELKRQTVELERLNLLHPRQWRGNREPIKERLAVTALKCREFGAELRTAAQRGAYRCQPSREGVLEEIARQ